MNKIATVATDLQHILDTSKQNPKGVLNKKLRVPIQNMLNIWRTLPPTFLANSKLNAIFNKFSMELIAQANLDDKNNPQANKTNITPISTAVQNTVQQTPIQQAPAQKAASVNDWIKNNCKFANK